MVPSRHPSAGSRPDECGAAAVEFALLLPLLVCLLLGAADATRYLVTAAKIHRVATTSADLVARRDVLHTADLQQILAAAPEIARPLAFEAAGGVILTGVMRSDGAGGRRVAWQAKSPNFNAPSRIGSVGGTPQFPDGFDLRDGETAIFAEAFYTFQGWTLIGKLINRTATAALYERAVFRPRLGTLATVEP